MLQAAKHHCVWALLNWNALGVWHAFSSTAACAVRLAAVQRECWLPKAFALKFAIMHEAALGLTICAQQPPSVLFTVQIMLHNTLADFRNAATATQAGAEQCRLQECIQVLQQLHKQVLSNADFRNAYKCWNSYTSRY